MKSINQTNKTFGKWQYYLTDRNAKKKGENEKWFHRNRVERRNLFYDSRTFVPVGNELWFDDRWICLGIYWWLLFIANQWKFKVGTLSQISANHLFEGVAWSGCFAVSLHSWKNNAISEKSFNAWRHTRKMQQKCKTIYWRWIQFTFCQAYNKHSANPTCKFKDKTGSIS